jgi:hypothetical protein
MTDTTNTDPAATDAADAAGDTAAATVEPWYCDQCGARYAGPGICENQHAPTELVELAPDAAAETGQDPAPVAEPEPAAGTPADAGKPAPDLAAGAAASDAAPAVELPDTINIGTTVQTTVGGTPYSGSISVSLTKQTPPAAS